MGATAADDCGGNFLQSKAGSTGDGAGIRVDAAAATTESAALRQ